MVFWASTAAIVSNVIPFMCLTKCHGIAVVVGSFANAILGIAARRESLIHFFISVRIPLNLL